MTSGDAEALKLALFKNGPVAVSIDASHRSFVFYSHGVYYEPACGKRFRAVRLTPWPLPLPLAFI